VEDIINSKKINEAFLESAEEMFELEFTLKQKAQLKYLQVKQKKIKKRSKLFNMLSHDFLWTPTPAYYLTTAILF
jgi:hypothetical protein